MMPVFSCVSCQDMPFAFKSCLMVSVQCFLGLPGVNFVVFASQYAVLHHCQLGTVVVVDRAK